SQGGTRYYDPRKIRSLARQPPPPVPFQLDDDDDDTGPEPSTLEPEPPTPAPMATGSASSAPTATPRLSAEASVMFRQFTEDVEFEMSAPGGEFHAVPRFAAMLPEIAARLGADIAVNAGVACRANVVDTTCREGKPSGDGGELSLLDFQRGIRAACRFASEVA